MFLQNVGQKSTKNKAKKDSSAASSGGKPAEESQAAKTSGPTQSTQRDSILTALAVELKEAVEITHRAGGPECPFLDQP